MYSALVPGFRETWTYVATVMLVAACASPAGTQHSSTPGSIPPSGTPPPSRVVAASTAIAIAHPSYSIAADEEGVWLRAPDGHVTRIDPTTHKVAAEIEVPASEFGHIDIGSGAVWVTDFDHNTLIRIDPMTNQRVADISVGANPEGVTASGDTVWVSNHRGGSFSKVSAATNKVEATFTFGDAGTSGPKDIVILDGDLWTSVPNKASVYRIDPETGETVKKLLIIADDLGSPMTDGKLLYVPTVRTLTRIDPASNAIVDELQADPYPAAFGLSAFWSIDGLDVVRLDARTLVETARWRFLAEAATPPEVTGMAFDDDSVWLVVDGRTVVHVEPET